MSDRQRDPETGKFVSNAARGGRVRRVRQLLSKGDWSRGDGYSIILGAIVGVVLAHYPPLAGPGAIGTVTGGAIYRLVRRMLRSSPEGAIIQYLDTFLIGVIVLFAVTWTLHNGHLDFVFHLFGGHSHA